MGWLETGGKGWKKSRMISRFLSRYDRWKCKILFSFRTRENSPTTTEIAKEDKNIFVLLPGHLYSIEPKGKLG